MVGSMGQVSAVNTEPSMPRAEWGIGRQVCDFLEGGLATAGLLLLLFFTGLHMLRCESETSIRSWCSSTVSTKLLCSSFFRVQREDNLCAEGKSL